MENFFHTSVCVHVRCVPPVGRTLGHDSRVRSPYAEMRRPRHRERRRIVQSRVLQSDDQPSGDYETCQHPVAKN
eukprot:1575269-Prymnesium_polylepis.1